MLHPEQFKGIHSIPHRPPARNAGFFVDAREKRAFPLPDDQHRAAEHGLNGKVVDEGDVRIVKAAAARLRKPLEIRQMPFDELFQAVRDHRADFAAGALTITKGRSYDVDFSISYAEEGSAFLYHVGDPMPTMVRAEGLRVGAVESMTHDFYLTRHGIDPFRYATVEQACADLVAGKIDTIFYDRPALVEMAKASGGKLGVTPLETREHYGIAVRKDRYDYLEAVNAVIRERRSK